MKVILRSGYFHQTKAAVEMPMVPLPNVPSAISANMIRSVLSGNPFRWVGKNLFLTYKEEGSVQGESMPLFQVRLAPN